MDVVAKSLIIVGLILVVVGGLLLVLHKLPGMGKLPGDITIKRDNFILHLPLMTMLIISILLTVALNLIIRK